MASGNEPYTCDGSIEYCATTDIFPKDSNFISETPYIMMGVVLFADFIIPIGYYFGRMAIRAQSTGTRSATNWVDITGAIFMTFCMILFVAPMLVWPFHWVQSEQLDWVIGWMFINMIAEAMPALVVVFWFWYLIVAIGSGVGSETVCETVNGTQICTYNKMYVSAVDGWVTWTVYTILAGLSYFVTFWFGADAVRYLRPDGGYDLYYLWPSLIYELLVITGVAPDSGRQLDGYDELFNSNKKNTAEADDHTHDDDDHSHDDDANIDAGVLLASF